MCHRFKVMKASSIVLCSYARHVCIFSVLLNHKGLGVVSNIVSRSLIPVFALEFAPAMLAQLCCHVEAWDEAQEEGEGGKADERTAMWPWICRTRNTPKS